MDVLMIILFHRDILFLSRWFSVDLSGVQYALYLFLPDIIDSYRL